VSEDLVQEWAAWVHFWAHAASNPTVAAEINRVWAGWRKSLEQLIKRGQADGSIDAGLDPTEEATSITAMIDGVGVRALFAEHSTSRRRVSPRALSEHMIEVIMGRLEPDAPTTVATG
jgi:hypothetical protein